MSEKDPSNLPLIAYLWVIILSSLGGFVSYIRKSKQKKKDKIIIFIELASEILISVFAGVLVFYACEHFQVAPLLTAIFVAISGYLGGNTLDLITKKVLKTMEKFHE